MAFGSRIVLVVALACAASVAHGAPPRDAATEEARARFKVAETLYSLQKYDEALVEYEKAYELKPLPGFLFNIAQCHRQLGHWKQAGDYYREYLEKQPRASNREIAKDLLAEVDAKAQTESATTVAPTVPNPSEAAAATAATTPRDVAPTAPAATRPLYKRWWVWAIVGGVVAAGVVTAALVASSGSTQFPQGSLSTVDAR